MREYIDKIVKNGKSEDMECLTDIMIDTLNHIKECDYKDYKKNKAKIIGMAYDYKLDKELAKEIVEDMKPLGEYWNMETVYNAIGNDNHRLEDMYVVMNSLVNDYSNVISPDEVDIYIKMAHAWIDDVDGKENKVWKYFID